jgi:hypothetical protein
MTRAIVVGLLLVAVAVGCSSTTPRPKIPFLQTLTPGTDLPGCPASVNKADVAAQVRRMFELLNCEPNEVDPAAARAGGQQWQNYVDGYVTHLDALVHSVYADEVAATVAQQLSVDANAIMRTLAFGIYQSCRVNKFKVDAISQDGSDLYVRFQVNTQSKPIPGLQTRVVTNTLTADGWTLPSLLWQVFQLKAEHGALRLVDSANVNPPDPSGAAD